ncbi:MAG: flagellar basal-body MS-ring/collar protein FliF [bacterium]
METQLSVILNDIKKLWNGLEFMQKLVIMLLLVASVFAVSFIAIKSMEPEWGVLYSDLSDTDANAVIESLKKSGYPFKLSDDRKTILVPLKAKEELRLMVAQNDVIQDSNPGFDLLNKMQFGATDFQNKLTRQKIFQDELIKTIEKIRGIQKARVQIAEPDRSVFADKDEQPSASVMLILESGTKLKADQIKAIKNLVAYGIPRLTPEKVFVTDQSGVNLAEDSDSANSSGDDYKTQFEKEAVKKVQKVIQNIVGVGNVSVEVSADINFDRTKTTTEKYLPATDSNGVPTGVLSDSKEESEVYDKGQKAAGNTDAAINASEPSSGKNYEKIRTSKNYNVSKEVSQVVYAPGKVQRMTIAVALNKILTTKEKDEIKKLVISASGADETRGDIITITGMQFAMNPDEQGNQMVSQLDKTNSQQFLIQSIAPLVVILVLGLGALFVLSSLFKKPLSGEIYDSGRYYGDEAIENEEPGMISASGEGVPILGTSMDPVLEKIKTDINATILSDPAEAARLLQSFIKD